MATFRGMDGTATYGTTAIANLLSWTMNETLGVIDTTVKGDKFQGVKGGVVRGTAQIRCRLDAVTGQLALLTALMTATPTVAPAALILQVDTGKTYTTTALYTGCTINSPEGEAICDVTFNFTLSSQVVEAWA